MSWKDDVYDYFKGKCGNCSHIDPNRIGSRNDRVWCKKRDFYTPLKDTCGSQDDVKYPNYNLLYELKKRCYIINVICEILGLNKSYDCIDELVSLRLMTEDDGTYSRFFAEYDKYGVIIAEKLKNEEEPDRQQIAKRLFDEFVIRIYDYMEAKDMLSAFEVFADMYNFLKSIYIDSEDVKNNPQKIIGTMPQNN